MDRPKVFCVCIIILGIVSLCHYFVQSYLQSAGITINVYKERSLSRIGLSHNLTRKNYIHYIMLDTFIFSEGSMNYLHNIWPSKTQRDLVTAPEIIQLPKR